MSALHDNVSDRVLALLRPMGWSGGNDAILSAIATHCAERTLAPGEVLMTAGDPGTDIFLIESGTLAVEVEVTDGQPTVVGQIGPGQAAGEMQFVLGGRRTATVRAAEPTVVFRLSRADFDAVLERWPSLLHSLVTLTRERIHRTQLRAAVAKAFPESPTEFANDLEAVADWVTLRSGEVLFRQGDAADGWYLVVTGRLRVVKEGDGATPARVLQELDASESVGEMAILSGARRAATVVALRDSLVARIPADACTALAQRHPELLLAISRTLVHRLQAPGTGARPMQRLVVAVLQTTRNPALDRFARNLVAALGQIGPAAHVTAAALAAGGVVGPAARPDVEHPSWLRFPGWLESLQREEPFVVLDVEPDDLVWAHHALGQADHVLILGDASGDPARTALEQTLLGGGIPRQHRRQHTLVLVHPAEARRPHGTRAWLGVREVDRHLHVRDGRMEDAARVARALTGRSVGVVLGGGGARGFAHLGVVRAFRELGIPVDYIGGTSMGAIMAGQIALGLDHDELVALNRPIVALSPFTEYTIPVVALLKTEKITQSAKMAFGDTRIEDLWLPYFAVSANLTTATTCVHEDGPVWFATRASGSLPGIAVPVVRDRELLVDGGVLDNLPVGIMRDRCAGGPVIAVDVSPAEDLRMSRDAFPSPWAILGERVRPGPRPAPVPGIVDILMRTTLLASAAQRERSWREADLMLSPPVDAFGMLAFDQLDALVDVGYRYTLDAAADAHALLR